MDLIGRQIDHYRIDSLLGEGGMGAVYRAWDVNLARPVALKVMHRQFANQAEFQRRFMQEAQAAARLSHPSIAAVHNFGTANGFFYMVMEFIPGGSLNTYLNRLHERRQLVRLDETLPVLAQVADALGYAHRQGVVHRDIKPDNIILRPLEEPDREGEPPIRAIVTDFGLAKLMEGGMHTQSGTFMGTLQYMSPEQALGKPLDGRSDIYSLGVLLYQLATGRLPFDIRTPTEAVMKHINETPPSPRTIRPGLPRTIERIILRAIAKEPADRFQTGEEFARAMRQAATNLTDVEVSNYAPPETVISLVTQLEQVEATPPPQPSRPVPTGRSIPAGASQAVTQSGQLGVVVQPSAVTVAPGGRADVQVELLNQGYDSDHYRLTVVGLPPEWVTVSHDSTQLRPGGQSVLSVTIHPPQAAATAIAARPYQLVVASTSNPTEVATIPGQLTVLPFERFLVDMRPERVPNQGIARVLVRNDGNNRATYTVTARDPAGEIAFDNERAQLTLEPGMRGTVDVRLSARQRPLTGSPRLLPFAVEVTTPAGQRQVKEGQLEVRPALPGWALPLLGLLGVCLCVTVAGLYAIYGNGFGTGGATQTAEALAAEQTASAGTQIAIIAQQTAEAAAGTAVAATATAEAAELAGDDDGDGLSNSDEERWGTDRGKADTDEDGLSDGEEVNQYGTNPLRPDSDEDGLSDGDEVNVHHTSPINPDTDGDGVPDGVEIEEGRNPLLPETPTAPPTETPTATFTPTATNTPAPPTATPTQPAPTVIVLPTATPSATAAATATATTAPAGGNGALVFVDDGELRWLALELDNGLWQAGDNDEQLANVDNVVSVKISPNGQRAAFVAEVSNSANELYVVNLDGTGLASLVSSADLPPTGEGTARLIDSYQWLGDNQTIAFNTLVINLQGPGTGSNEDLWTVAAGSDPVLRFEPGQGGGAFDIAGNRVVMSNDTEIIRANLDGSGREVVHTFPFINTASEYIYYPVPHWTANGNVAYVAIPSPEPFSGDAEAAVWQIPNNGAAAFVTNLTGNILFQPVYWTDNGNRLAYVRQVTAPSNPPMQLYIGGGDGFANLNPYGDEAGLLTFLDWSGDSNRFLYYEQNGAATAYVGTVGEAPVAINTPGNQILTGRWLTNSTYFIVAAAGNNQRIMSGNLAGETVELVMAQTTLNGVDAWIP